MKLEIVRGIARNVLATKNLIENLKRIHGETEGTLYIGYPIIATADDSHTIEALLISDKFGLVAFNFPQDSKSQDLYDEQDKIAYSLESTLSKYSSLRKKRRLAVEPSIISYFPTEAEIPNSNDEYLFTGPGNLENILNDCPNIAQEYLKALNAAIQRVSTMRPAKKRLKVKKENSKGAKLKIIEKEIANLDKWQKQAAIETAHGPQRVRGLAGSGKTIVLALKASIFHTEHPEWNISITYHTRSLKQQFIDLIERFTMEHSGDKPNWEKIKILHSWGSNYEEGIYSEISNLTKILPQNYANAKSKYGINKAFEGICNELLISLKNLPNEVKEIYDAILIDEAQDLPDSFFKIVYQIVKSPKRIIWAYDELQKLNDTKMLSTEELFGIDSDGNQIINIKNEDDEAKQDIVLPVCYRNTPWALTIAHGLGLGVNRKKGLVQLFENLNLFTEIGYKIEKGNLALGEEVTLERKKSASPQYFEKLINPGDAIKVNSFENREAQYMCIAEDIKKNISEEELEHDDFLVIFPNAMASQKEFSLLADVFSRNGLQTHLAGVTTDKDTFYLKDSITAASIFRAKGNEAPMVYIVNTEWCADGFEIRKLRNILFTAITRSKAWLNICGIGEDMKLITQEIEKIKSNEYKLKFKIPTVVELKQIHTLNRDFTPAEEKDLKEIKNAFRKLEKLKNKGFDVTSLKEVRNLLRDK